jgi:hypothetical protein
MHCTPVATKHILYLGSTNVPKASNQNKSVSACYVMRPAVFWSNIMRSAHVSLIPLRKRRYAAKTASAKHSSKQSSSSYSTTGPRPTFDMELVSLPSTHSVFVFHMVAQLKSRLSSSHWRQRIPMKAAAMHVSIKAVT